jgi:hypothetical protein
LKSSGKKFVNYLLVEVGNVEMLRCEEKLGMEEVKRSEDVAVVGGERVVISLGDFDFFLVC